jgi:hypothetical protein
MKWYGENGKKVEYPSLYESFELGDRVKRIYKNNYGEKAEYKGIVLAINEKGMEIYWDTIDGKYRCKDTNIDFTHLELEEIYRGNEKYSPLIKDK